MCVITFAQLGVFRFIFVVGDDSRLCTFILGSISLSNSTTICIYYTRGGCLYCFKFEVFYHICKSLSEFRFIMITLNSFYTKQKTFHIKQNELFCMLLILNNSFWLDKKKKGTHGQIQSSNLG